ncbi:MbnP family protein [Sphingobacterium suaedae]|uniref:MbnP family protein n=1 Tax=Sphingobacterium suaedae TaxID=1686402 RepID=A0ABW5KES7_9SPHI
MIKKSFFSIALLTMMASCSKDTELVEVVGGNLSIEFDNVLGNEDFALDKAFDIDGKTYTFNSFRYWVSNIRLQKQNGEWIEIPNSYYLIEETKDIIFCFFANELKNTDLT